jgi:hypothetical protein
MPAWLPGSEARQEARRARQAERAARRQSEREVRRARDEARYAADAAHQGLLVKAAGISILTLACHQDTWVAVRRFASERTGAGELPLAHKLPGRDGGIIDVPLSGPAVVRVLSGLRIRGNWDSGPDRALKERIYAAVAAVVSQVDPDVSPARVPPVVIDAGIPDQD